MKLAIEKAISGGFDLLSINFEIEREDGTKLIDWKCGEYGFGMLLELKTSERSSSWIVDISYYRLTFDPSLGFVEALVGELDMCTSTSYCNDCVELGVDKDCPHYKDAAHYHRSIMANLPDIEALKQYLIKLAGDTP